MLLNWARKSHSLLYSRLFLKWWYTPLLLIVIYAITFVSFTPIGVLHTNWGFRSMELVSFLELCIISLVLLVVLVLLVAYSKHFVQLTTKMGLLLIGMCAIPFFFTYPLDALDYVANLWYSERVAIYNENPYTTTYNPSNTYEYTQLPSTPESPHLPYGPVWLAIHTGLYSLIRSFSLITITLVMKFVHFVLVLVTFAFVLKSAEILNKPSVPILIAIGMSPAILYTFVGTMHNDIYFIFVLALAVYTLIKQKFALMLLLLTVSVFIKYTAIVLLPFFLIWLFRRTSKGTFLRTTIPWVMYTSFFAIISVKYLGILHGITDQSVLYGFSPATIILYITNNIHLASYYSTAAVSIFFAGFLLMSIMYARNDEKDMPWLLRYCTAVVFLLILLVLNLWNYWYFVWALPFLIIFKAETLARILAINFLHIFSFCVTWYLFIHIQDIESFYTYSALFQTVIISFTVFVLTKDIIAPTVKKLL